MTPDDGPQPALGNGWETGPITQSSGRTSKTAAVGLSCVLPDRAGHIAGSAKQPCRGAVAREGRDRIGAGGSVGAGGH
ncbi:MAG: hypothetical protein M3O46_00140, partial [Myxococcota bacterium]|nr:hypothetical protein [Myxococcota bacterium]